jgi:glycosyltransferase involved in cell wall biosynthesis
MKVLILTSSFPAYPGDYYGNFIFELSKALQEDGIDLVVVCPHHPGSQFSENWEGVKIYRFPYFFPYSAQKLRSRGGLLNIIKKGYLAKLQVPLFVFFELAYTIMIAYKEDIDVIHSHWIIPQGLVGAICKKVTKAKHVVSIHGSDINLCLNNNFLRAILRFILSNADHICTNSSFTYHQLEKASRSSREKTTVIPMGIDMNRFNIRRRALAETNTHPKKTILSVGRLIDWKGTKYLLLAMEQVLKQLPDTQLIIGGTGPEKENLVRLTVELNIQDSVIFAGYIEDKNLLEYYSQADVFVLPSIDVNGQTEGLGVVLIEAMACSVPVIGSDVGGIPDIIQDGYNGYLVQEKNPEVLSDRIVELLTNPALAEKFGHNGFKTVKEKFIWATISRQFINEYLQVIGRAER